MGSFVFALLSEMRREPKGFGYDWRCKDWGFPLVFYGLFQVTAGCIGIGNQGAGLIALMVTSVIAARAMGTRMALEVLELEPAGLTATLKKGAATALKVVVVLTASSLALLSLQSFVFAYFPLPDLGIISSLKEVGSVFAGDPQQMWFRLSVISFIASVLGMFTPIWVNQKGLAADLQDAKDAERRSQELEMIHRREHPWMYDRAY